MNDNNRNKEVWQSGYISNNTRLNEIDLSKCDQSKIKVYSYPTATSNKKNGK